MKKAQIQAGKFYTLKTGELVRVDSVAHTDASGATWYNVWESDSQEAQLASSRHFQAQSVDPS